ncbi:hypothetical protein ACQ86O_04600 [Serratia sp. L9]|uniref:hypothetical protein n=1 Tax=Serratia sp. L9 TaxID=3423946 RepID=UPI003D668554
MIIEKAINIAILDEDKISCLGMSSLLNREYSSLLKVETFYTLDELIEMPALYWDLIIIDANGIDFTALDVFTWLDKIYASSRKRPKILFTHRSPLGQLPITILNFYSRSVYNKEDRVNIFIQKITEIIYLGDNVKIIRPHITKTEKEVLMNLSENKSIHYLSKYSGKEAKTLYSHKNSALAKLGVKSSDHFFARYNQELFSGLMKLSCFR